MRVFVVLAVATSLSGSSAWAAGNGQGRQTQDKVAKKACATGDYRKGIDILADLYVDTNDPVYVYNQGRCYEQNSRFEQAIERFREYLRKVADPTADERAEVDKHIADCESLMPKPAVTPPPPAPAPQPVYLVPSAPDSVPSVTTLPPAQAESGSGLRVAGLVTAGVGVAALVTALALNIEHESLVKEQSKLGNFSQSRESTVNAYETWAWVGYGVGAAAVVAGGVMYVMGRSSGRGSQQAVSLLPVVSGRGAGCLLQGAF